MKRVVFGFGQTQGEIPVDLPDDVAATVPDFVGRAWNGPDGRMFTIAGEDGKLVLINLSLVIAVTIQ